ncbi:unnamed protein product [Blumeria hordei]|uniref:Uncharacterized protein n=2 Tax=Blumeria hordei TaxID=2867405 RepID=A0A383UP47_BLUHO|nr:hypothetical protein BGHDH14_bgh03145 [Blumeria hordei DH14]SZF02104.1 unnamed protein product [Blumeria hordei]
MLAYVTRFIKGAINSQTISEFRKLVKKRIRYVYWQSDLVGDSIMVQTTTSIMHIYVLLYLPKGNYDRDTAGKFYIRNCRYTTSRVNKVAKCGLPRLNTVGNLGKSPFHIHIYGYICTFQAYFCCEDQYWLRHIKTGLVV